MTDHRLLIDLHRGGERQGPGGDRETERALDLALGEVDRTGPLRVADLGCGTGAGTLRLARLPNARITAVDLHREFLEVLEERAERAGVRGRITTLIGSMDALPFADGELDMIWAEGSVYNIGFEKGVSSWRRYLKPGGRLVVSEITWFTDTRPCELQKYWEEAYAEIDLASAKIRVLEKHGYSPVGYFALPEHCWLNEYYGPLRARFGDFLARHGNSEAALAVVAGEQREIELYERYTSHIGYGMYVARSTGGDGAVGGSGAGTLEADRS